MTIDTETRPAPDGIARQRRRRRGRGRRIAIIVAVPLVLSILGAFAVIFRVVSHHENALHIEAPPLALTPLATAAAPTDGTGGQATGGPMVDPAWIQRTAQLTGIPARALEGYGKAQLTIAATDPSCRLGWNTLAGIGWIETGHGTSHGSSLLADGRTSQLILGPALDGTKGTSAIAATAADQVATGDPKWDHAAGPMQFIGGTWARWGADGNHDGIIDRNNIDDASLAAANYLCAGGRNLSTGDGWYKAIHSYNHSDAYVLAVNKRANKYALAATTS